VNGSPRPLARHRHETRCGRLTLIASDDGLRAVLWPDEQRREFAEAEIRDDPSHPIVTAAARQLDDYGAGRRSGFDLPLAVQGTEFQQRVWRQVARIPYGETTTYGKIARQLGRPRAAQAVGAAVGRNPTPIVVPCHRVIGADGSLTGFGGGLELKRSLLNHEAGRTSRRAIPLPGWQW
jgi:methylated-DNA-[protein]-cysteine S-methyltransferase